jgi:hypothetical protein
MIKQIPAPRILIRVKGQPELFSDQQRSELAENIKIRALKTDRVLSEISEGWLIGYLEACFNSLLPCGHPAFEVCIDA